MKRLAHYSQHFLRSPRLAKELIGHSTIKPDDLVYDIGAGSGVISAALAGRCQKVVAVEFEPRTADGLRRNMQKFSNVTVAQGDFMKMSLPQEPYKILANIPFHLSSPIVRKLLETNNPPKAVYLIVQKQFAEKLQIDTERFTGMLGAYIAPWFSVRIRKRLHKTDFWPHPNVDTVFIELKLRDTPLIARTDMEQYRIFVEKCFSTPKLFHSTPREKAGIPLDRKPSQVSLEQWVRLFGAARP